MSIAIAVVLWALGICLVVVVLAIVMPLRLELDVHKREAWQFRAALRPFGRFGPRIALSGRKAKADKPKRVSRESRTKPKRRKPRFQGLARAAARLVGDVLRCVSINTARLQMRFGLGDPAETGQLFGYLAPVLYASAGGRKLMLDVEPVFDHAVFEGQAELDLSVVPASLLVPFFRFGWTAFGPVR